MYYLETGYDKHTRMRNALLLAVALHAALVLAVTFDTGASRQYSPQIEVTLATRPSQAAPDDARHVAQHNQEGSGQQAEKTDITTINNAPANAAQAARQAPLQNAEKDATRSDELLSTRADARRTVLTSQAENEQQQASLEGISPEVDRLNQQLASLEAELDQETRNYASMPRVRRLTSASARQAADAAYLLDWRQRVEAVGNKYYPEASVRYGIYGNLRLLVVIRKDGSLEDIRVLSSSGYAVLDEAAIKIVRMAAPYSPFPPELSATTDKLEIIRTWQFQENQLSSD